jgi:hypothetical protein
MSVVSRSTYCKGKKAALLIGINYAGTESSLQGCENDIANVNTLLTSKYGFKSSDIVCMTDRSESRLTPTRENILRALKELQGKTKAGYDNIVLHYSGHGTHIRDVRGDEVDGEDEAWYTLDGLTIKDDELRTILNGFSPFARVFVLIDACHSGSILDLPLRYVGDANTLVLESTTAPMCDVLMISGCRDAQTSEDAYFDKTKSFNGAMTMAFMEHYATSNTVFDLVQNMNDYMRKNGHEQDPQLSTSRLLKGQEHLSEWLR